MGGLRKKIVTSRCLKFDRGGGRDKLSLKFCEREIKSANSRKLAGGKRGIRTIWEISHKKKRGK